MTLLNVFSQVSLDYAIVAQKLGHKTLMHSTQPAFDKNYGLELESLTNLYDQQIEAKIQMAINPIYNSHSWRITAPLRWIVMQFKLLFSSLKNNKS